jgi:hypothetical protein
MGDDRTNQSSDNHLVLIRREAPRRPERLPVLC